MPQRMAGAKTVFADNLLPESSGATEAPEGGQYVQSGNVARWGMVCSRI